MIDRFQPDDRVRHPRGWYGAVIEDRGGEEVLVRFDDGTPHACVPREKLRRVDELDAEVAELTAHLRTLRVGTHLGTDDIATVARTIEALSLALTDRGLRVRVAAEIDRIAEQVVHAPFDAEIAKQPRVRQWFAAGARWALQQMRDASHLRRDASTSSVSPAESKVA